MERDSLALTKNEGDPVDAVRRYSPVSRLPATSETNFGVAEFTVGQSLEGRVQPAKDLFRCLRIVTSDEVVRFIEISTGQARDDDIHTRCARARISRMTSSSGRICPASASSRPA